MPHLSSPKPRLRHGMQHAHLCLVNVTLNLYILSFVLSLALLFYLSFHISPTAPLPRDWLWSSTNNGDLTFLFFSQSSWVTETEASCPSSPELCVLRSLIRLSAPLSPLNFSWLPRISPRPLPLVQTKLSIPSESTFLALAWIFF